MPTCLYCQKEFTSVRVDAKFCCTSHRVAYSRNGGSVTDNANPPVTDKSVTDNPSIVETLTEAVCEKHLRIPIWMDPVRLAKEPLIIPKDLSKEDLKVRLGRMRDYRRTFLKKGVMRHVLTEDQIKTLLVRSGYSHKLSGEVMA